MAAKIPLEQLFTPDQVQTYNALAQKLAKYVQPVSHNKYIRARFRLALLLNKGELVGRQTTFVSSFKWGDTPEGHAFWEEISTVCNDPFKGLGSEDAREII